MRRNFMYMLCTILISLSLSGCNKGGASDGLEIVEKESEIIEEQVDNQEEDEELEVKADTNQDDSIEKGEKYKKEIQENEAIETVFACYVCGAVIDPGVYEFEEGSRICDAIQRAEGFKEGAAEIYLNQAELLSDGQMIYVPTQEEIDNGELHNVGNVASSGIQLQEEGSGLVNINTATKDQLMTLSGIGESKAESIIEYRETNGSFVTIEDIQNIPGIKAGVFIQIKDEITT